METLLDILSWALLVVGGAFVFVGGVGALRMPDFYTRMHAASLTDTLGTILVLTGLMLQSGISLATAKLLAIMMLLLFTAPTAAYALANAARLSGLKPYRTGGNREQ
ncbi:MAG: monovalent cation/H(+) antiporter subunit G [Woeseia sp.]